MGPKAPKRKLDQIEPEFFPLRVNGPKLVYTVVIPTKKKAYKCKHVDMQVMGYISYQSKSQEYSVSGII